jgi:flagellar biosynthesis protein FlhF
MKQLLDGCGSGAEIHLVVAAPAKYLDIREIFQQFEPFKYRSVIISKLDETIRVGNVISALAERGKPLSYITNGQKVPTDIQRAGIVPLLLNLEGFKINRDRIDERFSPDNAEQN